MIPKLYSFFIKILRSTVDFCCTQVYTLFGSVASGLPRPTPLAPWATQLLSQGMLQYGGESVAALATVPLNPPRAKASEQLCLTQMTYWAKIMSLPWPGPHIKWQIIEGRTWNGLLWS